MAHPRPPAAARVAKAPPPLAPLQRAERWRILEALRRHRGNRLRAAEALGMPRRTFYRRLDAHGIQPAGASGRRTRTRRRGPGTA
ncbi:MAG TPA: helix-turn-helix domain-containing protein [Polyangiaceae bacterium]|nr:helix-turn-helix domain-containing protein [Polyangiaceae bacterium]